MRDPQHKEKHDARGSTTDYPAEYREYFPRSDLADAP